MASVTLKDIKKIYYNYPDVNYANKDIIAVNDFNLEIKDGEVIVFVGPSGCGKTTTLRMIAGLEEITSGELYIGGRLVNDVEPKDRDITMVFQNYALFPQMTVYENIAFGLQPTDMAEDAIKEKVDEIARVVEIIHLYNRKPKELSGGQKQRVALARALIRDHKVILLDEPLSNLDVWLRTFMRVELMKIHQKFETTFIYVTHDQAEAMAIADRVVVMKDGMIQQVGTPEELYKHPCNLFVAGFLGTPQMNFFAKEYRGKEVWAGVRPEDLYVGDGAEQFEATVDVREFLGDRIYLYCQTKNHPLTARVSQDCKAKSGDKIKLAVNPDKIYLFDKDTEIAIVN